MATTVLQILTDAAYRLGENGNPDNASEQLRRISFLNQGIRHILRQRFWWFLQKEYSTQTVDGQDIYSLPSDYRDIIELRIDGKVLDYYPDFKAFKSWDKPVQMIPSTGANDYYYIWDNKIRLIPEASSTPSAVLVSSIVVSGTTATVTTATAHGFEIDDYVVIAGASVDAFNTSHQITSVPSTTTYTIAIASGTANPTGTITTTQNNLVIKYFYTPSNLTATTDTVIIPDMFVDALSAYIFARVAQLDSERGDASDGFDEFNEIITQMIIENNKRNSWGKAVRS